MQVVFETRRRHGSVLAPRRPSSNLQQLVQTALRARCHAEAACWDLDEGGGVILDCPICCRSSFIGMFYVYAQSAMRCDELVSFVHIGTPSGARKMPIWLLRMELRSMRLSRPPTEGGGGSPGRVIELLEFS
jgi:hypothetical protein